MMLAVFKGTMHNAAWPIAKAAICLGVALAVLEVVPGIGVRRGKAAMALVAACLAGDLAWNNGPSESTALPPSMFDVLRPDSGNATVALLKDRVGPGGLDRVEMTGLDFHWPNASLVHRLHHVLGYNPVRLRLYTEATGAEDHAALPEQRRFSALFPSYRSRLADLLGLRFVATGVPIERIDPALRPGDLVLLARTRDGFVYENPRAQPRAEFKSRAAAADFGAILRNGRWPDVDAQRTVLLPPEAVRDAMSAAGAQDADVRIAHHRNAEILVDVRASAPGWLVLRDPYHPWWTAEIDGRETPILQADVLFRAVAVPAGAHRVRFVFRPFRGAWLEAARRWPVLHRIDGMLAPTLP
jgi:hypothetical protein